MNSLKIRGSISNKKNPSKNEWTIKQSLISVQTLILSLFFLKADVAYSSYENQSKYNLISTPYDDSFADLSIGELALRAIKNMINRYVQESEDSRITDADGNDISVETLFHGNLTAFRYYPPVRSNLSERQKYYFYFRYEPKDYSLIIAVYKEHGARIGARCIHFTNQISTYKMIKKVHSNIQSLVAEVAKELTIDLDTISQDIPVTNNQVRKLVGLASFTALLPMLGICLGYLFSTSPIKKVTTCSLTLATTIALAFILDDDAD